MKALFCFILFSAVAAVAETARVWPEPPAMARIAYVQSIRSPADLGIRISAWSRLAGWLSGQAKSKAEFSRPFGVAADENGNLCLTDTGTRTVWYFDRKRHKAAHWNRMGEPALVSPVGVACWEGRVAVADSGLGAVGVFNTEGKLRFALTKPLARPVAVAAGSGRIYVADAERHGVAVFDDGGKYLFAFGRRGVGPGEFNFPTHLAFGSGGVVLVTDSMNNRVERFSASGEFEQSIGHAGDVSGTFSRPKGVGVDRAGRVYVADALFDNFQIFDASGRLLLDVGSNGDGPGEFCLPAGMAVDGQNEIFVADSYNHRVQVFKYIGP